MIDTNEFGKMLESMGFSEFVGVPCSYLAPLINYAINENKFISANNEGDAVALASGISLANLGANLNVDSSVDSHVDSDSGADSSKNSKNFAVVLMQNSGLSNALSPLTSLNHTFDIPILGFVSLRGERKNGAFSDEPQHELLGAITDKLLQTAQIKYDFLDENNFAAQLKIAHRTILARKSFFFIVRKNVFLEVELKNRTPLKIRKIHESQIHESAREIRDFTCESSEILESKCESSEIFESKCESNPPSRLNALKVLHSLARENSCGLIATTGKTGRELYELGDAPNALYMVGSMGCASSLALGASLKSDKKIIAIDGDSALLMRLGALSTNAYYAKNNFCHVLLDNHSHDSTGGQFNLSPCVDFARIAASCGYRHVKVARNLSEFKSALNDFINSKKSGAHFVYLRISKGSKENLGRPKITPKEVALRFGKFLQN